MKKILLGIVLLICLAAPYATQAQVVVVVHPRRHQHHRHPISNPTSKRLINPLSEPCRDCFAAFRHQ